MNTAKSLLVIFLVAHFHKICGCYLYLQWRTHLKTLMKYHPNEPLKNWQSRKIDPYKFKWFKSNYPVILVIFLLFAFRSLLQIQDLPRHDLLSQDLGDSLYGAPDTSPQATSLDWSDLSLLLVFLQYPGKLENKQSLVFCNLIITGNWKLVCYIYPSRESSYILLSVLALWFLQYLLNTNFSAFHSRVDPWKWIFIEIQ